MVRLALILGAAIYAGLVIFSGTAADDAVEVTRANPTTDPTVPVAARSQETFVTADGRELSIAAIVDPATLGEDGAQIALVSTRDGTGEAETVTSSGSASGGEPEVPLVEITGDYVNLRAGPSTQDAILAAMSGGDRAELIDILDNGWVQIRAVSSGLEGYMADRFVTRLD